MLPSGDVLVTAVILFALELLSDPLVISSEFSQTRAVQLSLSAFPSSRDSPITAPPLGGAA